MISKNSSKGYGNGSKFQNIAINVVILRFIYSGQLTSSLLFVCGNKVFTAVFNPNARNIEVGINKKSMLASEINFLEILLKIVSSKRKKIRII